MIEEIEIVDQKAMIEEIEIVDQEVMIEEVEIVDQKAMIEEIEIVDQEVIIEEIEIVDQEVMIEEIKIVNQEVMKGEDDQVMIAEVDNQISSIMQNKEIQKLFKEFLNQKLNSDNISSYINKEDLLSQNHSRSQEQSSQRSPRQSNQSYFQIQDRTSLQEGSSSLNIRSKYLDLTNLSNNLLVALRLKPIQTPNWMISGYEGPLRAAIQNACAKQSSIALPQ
ncbi:16927_t:CDS:2 [Dentiscutata erythropus]|uniref:16927_t:CDS:1 n=1 Tax=Dentiscutata erythropus TaxID=1348616 RepID=A0A9N9E3G7_9GLOM|nr:16927_t:CDS:2 [Dentiscutata erythropus]